MGPPGMRSTNALPACATSGGAMAMAGSTAVPSLGSDDMLGMNSSGSSGGSAATESMELSAKLVGFIQVGFYAWRQFGFKDVFEGYGARVVLINRMVRAALMVRMPQNISTTEN